MSQAAFSALAAFLHARSGLVLGPDKLYLVETRLGALMKREKIADLGALVARISSPTGEALAREVVELMTTNETFFFRDGKPFDHVKTTALKRLHAARPPGQPIRIWSAACSTGQEAYSLAMIVDEARPWLGDRRVEIIGTDLSRDVLARAREGLYSQFEVQRGLPIQMLVKYFRQEGASWRLCEAIRAMVTWREFNLLGDLRPLGRFDIVFCRNVLIYFDQPTKARVLAAIAAQMPPDGVLYLGGAETVLGITDRFAAVAGERGVYEPVAGPRTAAA
ncbi:protein-glutamate O-methyltransferase CheR [Elioraea tepida]|jgi:chemotaxis protein methyltransferase CheR|uniref:Protein-glutamate O-methyltransferase CheR n=1 Tax=Elioraea tepida TaxID=2843330 RepID=A0A975U297_9PROT|nr:protein-glutamate O-methyltransferase CheR [Elioraea tepida]QXM24433.1 protein-glutamate O-methyltransferase CheR [Elioraea tepida]